MAVQGLHQPKYPVRVVTAASLFDGHDAAINIMRRILQSQGAEVIHLGHDRSVAEVARAAVQEDVQAVAVSSYQGGHVEYFTYLRELLDAAGGSHIRVYGGGGGVIVADEIALLAERGVTIFSPEDGQRLGLPGMINTIIAACDTDLADPRRVDFDRLKAGEERDLAAAITVLESAGEIPALQAQRASGASPSPSGASRSPSGASRSPSGASRSPSGASRSPSGASRSPSGARGQAPESPGAMPTSATSGRNGPAGETPEAAAETPAQAGRTGAAGEDPTPTPAEGLARTPVLGITGTGGSGKSSLTDELVRRFRLDYEDKLRIAVLAIDPSRRRGGGALLGDRIRMNALGANVYFRSMATRHRGNDVPACLPGVIDACRAAGYDLVIVETPGIGQGDSGLVGLVDVSLYVMTPEFGAASQLEKIDMLDFADVVAINKFERRGAEDARRDVARQLVRNRGAFGASWEDMPVFGTSAARFNDDGVTALYGELQERLTERGLDPGSGLLARVSTRTSSGLHGILPPDRGRYLSEVAETVRRYHEETDRLAELAHRRQALRTAAGEVGESAARNALVSRAADLDADISDEAERLLESWPRTVADYGADSLIEVHGTRETVTPLTRQTLAGTPVPRVALPQLRDDGDVLSWLRRENLPGRFPYTAGVFGFKRTEEDPARMFAGEGDPFRTNRRFHLLSKDAKATRLSTAFDSVTLYGRDPDRRPDIYGKVGTSGVSVATLDDMKALYDGFDLLDPSTSVSMTINGPAPAILAMFLNTAIDQQVDRFQASQGRGPTDDERQDIRARTLSCIRGTVQADILKEDQGQNTCLFSTEFSLRCMADIQEWFIANSVRNFYSVSISGYHIAEAGANPISQLAFTLANAFTYVEAYLDRGMDVDDFAPNLSFFFSNGMDAEYAVLGRVARRIWAIAMREKYGANARSQKLKYHVQTSGRSLHAQEMSFNDIRTTLQALIAIYDNCNSLHTNAFDEAVTTPTPESVRRALAIQLIINNEWGLAFNENPQQGAYVVDRLTDLVEEAVLAEFDRLTDRGGVLGAMETGYQRGRIQDESLLYEHRKHDGSLPVIGVNTFRAPAGQEDHVTKVELMRATEAEKESQLTRLADFHRRHAAEAPAALARLQRAAVAGENTFEVLMDAVRVCSLGQITQAFFEVGGQYRRNM